MITTVTAVTATVTTVALAGTLGGLAVLTLILLLGMREGAGAGLGAGVRQTLVAHLSVPIIPLVALFALIIALRVAALF